MTPYVPVPRSLLVKGLNGYSVEALQAKQAFHRDALKFLRSFARRLSMAPGSFDVRSNKGGMAGSGEVTLHSDDFYLQLHESCLRPGVQALFRTCDSRKDYAGHTNNTVGVEAFQGHDAQDQLVQRMQHLIEAARGQKRVAV